MASSPRFAFLLIFLAFLHSQILPKTAFARRIIFCFPPFSQDHLNLLGTSSIQNGSLWLTENGGSLPSTSIGAALFSHPISASSLASFSTNFTFSIANPNLDSLEGSFITFFLIPDASIRDLLHTPQAIKTGSIFFLEFRVSENLKETKSDLMKSTIGIEYEEGGMKLTVSVGNPAIMTIEERRGIISNNFDDQIIAGFLSSKKSSSESHVIESWNLSSSTHINTPQHPISRSLISTDKHSKPTGNLGDILSRSAAVVACASVLLFACVNVNEQLHRRFSKRNSRNNLLLRDFQQFEFRQIVAGTRNFSEQIGHGVTSRVYKMTVPHSSAVYAVKHYRDDEDSQQGYQNELEAITRVRHENILELRGWCDKQSIGEKLLIFDFMPQGTLHRILHSEDAPILPWIKRYEIAIKLARALRYLHEDCSPYILHGDVKPYNILLSEEFEPKLSDFGIALHGPPYKAIGASNYYRAPECQPDSLLDDKADVYSYGMVVLEICTGKPASYMKDGLLKNVREQNHLVDAADKRLERNFDPDEMTKLLQVGLICTVEEKERRPAMALVLKVLEGEAEIDELAWKADEEGSSARGMQVEQQH